MTFRYERDGMLWIDLERPSREEIHAAVVECGIGAHIEEEIASPSPQSLVQSDENAALLILHFPAQSNSLHDPLEQEIDFVIGKDYVLTVHYEVVPSLHELRKIIETDALLRNTKHLTPDALLEILLNRLFQSVRDHSSYIENRLGRIEREIFRGEERAHVRDISEVNREFLHLEALVANQEEPLLYFLKDLENRALFGTHFAERAHRILSARTRIAHLLARHRAVATELRETNAGLINAGENEIMKRLTVITFTMLPLSLVVNIFEMNLPGVPFSDNPHAFWIVVGIMFVVSGFIALIFTRKRWL